MLAFLLALGPWGNVAGQASHSLAGHYVVLDPGHGGLDPYGSGRCLPGDQWMVREHNLANVVLRLVKAGLEAQGATVAESVRDTSFLGFTYYPCTKVPWLDGQTVYADGRPAEYSAEGLRKRVAPANSLVARFGQKRVAYLAIHFGWEVPGCQGSFLVIPSNGPSRLANKLLESLARHGQLRQLVDKSCPAFFRNGGSNYQRVIRVLRHDESPVINRVILEVANLANDEDFTVVSGPEFGRLAQSMADAVVEAFVLWARR